jgi:hypothetical protein
MLEISSKREQSFVRHRGVTMTPEKSKTDLISLSLAPFKQSLRLYAEVQRSALETLSRLGALGTQPWLSGFGGSSERAASAAAKRAAPAKRPAATKPATTKRAAATTKPATTKRAAATTKPAARKATPSAGRAVVQKASKKAAAAKTTPKPAVKRATAAKPAPAKKAASKPSRPRSTRTGTTKKA